MSVPDSSWPFPDLPARVQERLLIEELRDKQPARVLCTSLGRGQLAYQAATEWPQAEVRCQWLDLYRAAQMRELLGTQLPANLRIDCAADFPPEEVDLVALPLPSDGEAELARDLLQTGYQRLALGGTLLAASDNPKDSWLQSEIAKLAGKSTRRADGEGVVYTVRKTEPLKKQKDFSCTFVYRDGDRLIQARSRPGVFAHRRVDPGARKVLGAMQIRPGEKVLDLGCGSGVLTLAAAQRAERVTVHAVDSAARAVECTLAGAELNGLTNVTAELDATGEFVGRGTYTLVLANPPYYANFRIAEHFVAAAYLALRPRGTLLLVTKFAEWYADRLPDVLADVTIEQAKDYWIVQGTKAG